MYFRFHRLQDLAFKSKIHELDACILELGAKEHLKVARMFQHIAHYNKNMEQMWLKF
jgi:hypothetical protein